MLEELKRVPEEDQVALNDALVAQNQVQATKYNPCHDMLAFGRGASWFATLQWWILGRWIADMPCYRLERIKANHSQRFFHSRLD